MTTTVGNPIDTYKKDGTIVRILVDYSGDDDHGSLEDDNSQPLWTIGFNNFEDDEVDEWNICGWDWSHDCFTEGHGTVIAWLPLVPELEAKPEAQIAPISDDPALVALVSAAKQRLERMTPEERAAMWEAQRQNYAKSLSEDNDRPTFRRFL